MAAVIPEAAEAVTAGEAAVSGAGEAAAAPRAARPGGRSRVLGGAQMPSGPSARAGKRLQRPQAAVRKERQRRKGGKRKGGFLDRPKGRNYQPVILAEFLAAIVIVAISPVARGGSESAKAKNSPSPYGIGDVRQMVGVGGTYFVLALMSGSRKYGRLAAWFGGLVLLAVGLSQFVVGGITAIFKMLTGGGTPGAASVDYTQIPGITTGPPPGAAAPDATGLFPVIGPGPGSTGAQVAGGIGQALGLDNAQVTYISPPPGGTGVYTTDNPPPGTNVV